jgi:hypothetical protein
MDDNDLLSPRPLVGLFDPKLDGIAPPQPIGVHPVAEVVHMDEDVRLPIITTDETIPLLMIEPLDIPCYSIRHFTHSPYLINLPEYTV